MYNSEHELFRARNCNWENFSRILRGGGGCRVFIVSPGSVWMGPSANSSHPIRKLEPRMVNNSCAGIGRNWCFGEMRISPYICQFRGLDTPIFLVRNCYLYALLPHFPGKTIPTRNCWAKHIVISWFYGHFEDPIRQHFRRYIAELLPNGMPRTRFYSKNDHQNMH